MKSCNSKILAFSSAILALTFFCASAQNNSVQAVSINWVTIGATGNAANSTAPSGNNPSNATFGSVGYEYRISATEVTNAQYATFLNTVDPGGSNSYGLWDIRMEYNYDFPSPGTPYAAVGGIDRIIANGPGAMYVPKAGYENMPVVYVSYWDALRFANWLHNGQNTTFQTGAYNLTGSNEIPDNAGSVFRDPGANAFLPNENEWYKAAYYDPNTNSYFEYATGSNTLPTSTNPSGAPPNSANFWHPDPDPDGSYAVNGDPWPPNPTTNYLTEVGAYSGSASPFGTFDQNGNVWEWAEPSASFIVSSDVAVLGSSWDGALTDYLSALWREGLAPSLFNEQVGFRVASFLLDDPGPGPGPGPGGGEIPEPSTLLLAAVGVLAFAQRRRKA